MNSEFEHYKRHHADEAKEIVEKIADKISMKDFNTVRKQILTNYR